MGHLSDYLSADELADLVECKPNQRSKMIAWLSKHRWKYEIGSTGLPRVARAYRDKRMGIVDEPTRSRLRDEPDRDAFSRPSK